MANWVHQNQMHTTPPKKVGRKETRAQSYLGESARAREVGLSNPRESRQMFFFFVRVTHPPSWSSGCTRVEPKALKPGKDLTESCNTSIKGARVSKRRTHVCLCT